MNFPIMQFFRPPFNFLTLGTNIFQSPLFPNTLNLCTSPVWDQVSRYTKQQVNFLREGKAIPDIDPQLVTTFTVLYGVAIMFYVLQLLHNNESNMNVFMRVAACFLLHLIQMWFYSAVI